MKPNPNEYDFHVKILPMHAQHTAHTTISLDVVRIFIIFWLLLATTICCFLCLTASTRRIGRHEMPHTDGKQWKQCREPTQMKWQIA